MQRLPIEMRKFSEGVEKIKDRTFKDLFRGEIRGSFLIDMKYRVLNAMGLDLFNYYDMRISEEKMVEPGDSFPEYDICKHIIGIHRANTIFLTNEECSAKQRDELYKKHLTEQVVSQIKLRRYGSAYFRGKAIIKGERFIYYPVPYSLFVMCMRMNIEILQKGALTRSAYYFGKILNKTLSALSLLEDNFLGTSYLPCRTAIELYVKLMVLRMHPELFDEDSKFSYFEIIQTCCDQTYTDEFNKLFINRTNKSERNKVEYLHYGFVDKIHNYHNIVKQKPYTINGLLEYLQETTDEDSSASFSMIEKFHKMCHGYTHGNITEAKYPLLHYFEISLMLSCVVSGIYEMFCDDYSLDKAINGIFITEKLEKDLTLLTEQYDKRSTELFKYELTKFF